MNKARISIIIPIYNAEKYIDACMVSVLNQTFRQYEVILVDDGSTDRSPQICDDYSKKDSRITVIHKDNGGVSSARNCGLEKAKGEYIAFVDADDFLDRKYLEVLYQNAVKYGADISCCDYIEVINSQKITKCHAVRRKRIVNSVEECFEDYMKSEDYMQYSEFYSRTVWGKIIRKDFVANQKFGHIKFGEDTIYMFELFKRQPLIFLDTYAGYYYVRNEDSATISNQNSIDLAMDHICIGKALIELTANCSTLIRKRAINECAHKAYVVLSLMVRGKDKNDKHLSDIEANISEILQYQEVDFKYKILFACFLMSPKAYLKIMYHVLAAKHNTYNRDEL